MPRTPIPLNDSKIKQSKPKDKPYTLADGKGLQILIKPNGNKLWEFIYTSPTLNKRRKTSFSTYPVVSLQSARNKRTNFLRLLQEGIDPLDKKHQEKIDKQNINIKNTDTFKKIFDTWLISYSTQVTPKHIDKLDRMIEIHIPKNIRQKPISDITRKEIISILENIKEKKLLETTRRVFHILNKVFKYATVMEKVPHNIIADIELKVILGKSTKTHYPTFTKDKDIKGLLLAIDNYSGDYSTKMALKILPYLFVRSYNIRHCQWSEIDFENSLWIIPAEKMKTKEEFILPLPNQVLKLLNEIKQYTWYGKYVFPSSRYKDRALSDNTLIGAIRRMGYTKEEFVPHGFRAMFSTIAYEKANEENGHNFTSEVIESLLAHRERNSVKGAYNRAKYTTSMRKLIEWYADYLDEVKNA